jgi:hypothetical protein
MPQFARYWWGGSGHRGTDPAPGIVDRLALAAIWPKLTASQREALAALAATDDYRDAAVVLGLARPAFNARVATARHRFLALWHEGETPSRQYRPDKRHGMFLRCGDAPGTCRRGHPWDEANTRWRPSDGQRQCRACERASQARRATEARGGGGVTVIAEIQREGRRPAPRLPAGPLLAAVEAERAARGAGVRTLLKGWELRAYLLAKAEGSVTAYMAARLCRAISRHAEEVYGTAYEEAMARSLGPRPAPSAGPSRQHLPAAPLLEAIEVRRRRLEARLLPLFDEDATDQQRRAYERACQRGWVRLEAAELLCDAFGWHPYQIWGDAYDQAAFAGKPADFDPWAGVA